MQKSMIRLLVISFFTAFLMVSCGANPVKDLTLVPVKKEVFKAPYFLDSTIDYVYKTNISVYGNELSGICIIKKITNTHRVVFTTEFGNKLIDFEVSENDFKINSIVDELDRKILINTLKEDFRLLLRQNFDIQKQFENSDYNIYESENDKQYYFLYVLKANQKFQKIVQSSKRKEKFSILFKSENDTFAEQILINHQNIKLKIELNHLKNQ